MISIIILTHNEETNIARCLDSVSWSDDILVVDSFSEDHTVEISKRRGARVIQRAFEDFSSQRNFASEQGNLKHEWVLHLDADEVVTPELRAELAERCRRQRVDGFYLNRRFWFLDAGFSTAAIFPVGICGCFGIGSAVRQIEIKPCAQTGDNECTSTWLDGRSNYLSAPGH